MAIWLALLRAKIDGNTYVSDVRWGQFRAWAMTENGTIIL